MTTLKASKELTEEGFFNFIDGEAGNWWIDLGSITRNEFTYIKGKYPNIQFKTK